MKTPDTARLGSRQYSRPRRKKRAGYQAKHRHHSKSYQGRAPRLGSMDILASGLGWVRVPPNTMGILKEWVHYPSTISAGTSHSR